MARIFWSTYLSGTAGLYVGYRMVGQELHAKGLTFDIILLGGAAMLIEVGNQDSTSEEVLDEIDELFEA